MKEDTRVNDYVRLTDIRVEEPSTVNNKVSQTVVLAILI